jgi:hypothetical protein
MFDASRKNNSQIILLKKINYGTLKIHRPSCAIIYEPVWTDKNNLLFKRHLRNDFLIRGTTC